ncbi:MAG: S8 family serine peptidase [Chitinispirillaceae bacterium]|nr:S8 family serine peptidase [Chitinispirillaceae bacterium]
MQKGMLLLAGMFILLIGGGAFGQQLLVGRPQPTRRPYVADEVIVKFKRGTAEHVVDALNKRFGTSVFHTSRRGFRVMRFSGRRNVEQMVARFKSDPAVEYAEPNYIAYAYMAPNDPFYSNQWHLENSVSGSIHAAAAWDKSEGAGVVIGVIGTGVAYENYTQTVGWRSYYYYQAPDLAGTQFVAGWDFVNNDAHANDDEGHETHVCGTIAQTTNNGIGVAGIAFNSTVMPIKVLDATGSGSYSNVANGIIWAADNGATIVNLSLGGPSASTMLEDACRYAYEHGVTLICAAGNESGPVGYPAAYDNYCIAVGATRYDETRSDYSNYGDGLDVMAPGGDLNVDQNGDGYGDGVLQQTFGDPRRSRFNYHYDTWGFYFYQGTSMAAPHVTGIAALLAAAGVATTPDEIREVLQSTAKDLGAPGYDSDYGWGLVDAAAALDYSAVPNTPPEANAGGPYEGTEDIDVNFDGSGSGDAEGDPLTYSWDFGDGSTGSGVSPSHAYAAGGEYAITLIVNDGKENSTPSTTIANITEVNDPPVADAGPDRSAVVDDAVQFDGSASYDIDGPIVSYAWDFGDGETATGAIVSHTYAVAGNYTVTLTVADDLGETAEDIAIVTVAELPSEITVFSDGFDVAEWNGLWTEDYQNDWFRSGQRSVDGGFSAEVDGSAYNAQLISIPIDLQGKTNATVTFSWFIESGLDANEYIAFDVSTNGGTSWSEKARLRGNVDAENTWHAVSISLSGINNLRLRFRGTMSKSDEDANVDKVKVTAQ